MDNNLISNKELIEMAIALTLQMISSIRQENYLYHEAITFYNTQRLMVVPKSVVNEILGTEVA